MDATPSCWLSIIRGPVICFLPFLEDLRDGKDSFLIVSASIYISVSSPKPSVFFLNTRILRSGPCLRNGYSKGKTAQANRVKICSGATSGCSFSLIIWYSGSRLFDGCRNCTIHPPCLATMANILFLSNAVRTSSFKAIKFDMSSVVLLATRRRLWLYWLMLLV